VGACSIPNEKSEDGNARGGEKSEKRGRKRQQQAGEQAKSLEWEAKYLAAARARGLDGLRHFRGLLRLE
jgi:hypothetical protein